MNDRTAIFSDREKAMRGYRAMARMRAMTEVLILNRQDIFGPFLSGFGMEAVSVAPALALLDAGILLSSPKSGDHRTTWGLAVILDELEEETGHNHIYEIFKNHLLKETTNNRGRDGNIHYGCVSCRLIPFGCSDMGRFFPVLIGAVDELARKPEWRNGVPGERPVGVAFFGEGADQQGAIHEGNVWIAASNAAYSSEELETIGKFLDPFARETGIVRGSPVIQFVVANQFSIYTNVRDQHGRSDLAARASGYGNMRGINVDGDDFVAVYNVTRDAITEAQELRASRIIEHTYRRTSHNEDQIQRNPRMMEEARQAFAKERWDHEPDWADAKILGVDPNEFRRQWEREPLKRFAEALVAENVFTDDELTQVRVDARRQTWELYARAKNEPDVTVEENRKDVSVFVPYPSWSMPLEKPAKGESARRLTYQEAYIEGVREILRNDDRATFFGQDVRTGGVLYQTRKLADEFGPDRVFNTSIVEEAQHSNAAGRALVGGRPIFEGQQFASFFADAFPSIVSVLAPNWYLKRMKFSYVNIFLSGVVHDGGSGQFHESWPEAYLQHMLGITIVAPANAYDLIGLLRASHEYDGPVAMLLQIAASSHAQFASEIPDEPYLIPLGKAHVKRKGRDFTVIAYGAACVDAALNEADALAKEGVGVEVIDLRTVWPYDEETLRESIKKTGRFAVMHEDWGAGSVGEGIISQLTRGKNSILSYVRTPELYLVASEDVFVPTARVLVWDRLPYQVETAAGQDEKGRPMKHFPRRSPRLASVIRNALAY